MMYLPAIRSLTEMNSTIERGPYGAQFIIFGEDQCQDIYFQMEIMMRIRPQYLLPVFRQTTPYGHRYTYPITGLENLAELTVKAPLPPKEALSLVQQLLKILPQLEDQLLSLQQVLLQPESIFIRPDNKQLQLVFRPFLPVSDGGSLSGLVHWLAQHVRGNRFQRARWLKQASFLVRNSERNANQPEKQQFQAKDVSTEKITSTNKDASTKKNVPVGKDALINSETVLSEDTYVNLKNVHINNETVVSEDTCVNSDVITSSAAFKETSSKNKKPLNQVKKPETQLLLIFILPAAVSVLIWIIAWQADLLVSGNGLNPDQMLINNWRLLALNALILCIPGLLLLLRKQGVGLNPLPFLRKMIEAIRSKASAGPAMQERIQELPTELLSSRQELFRLATLSEGMLGTDSETAGQRAFILNDEFIIGRDARSVDLCLSGYAVGRRHARITRQGAAFFITDLGSKNGTRLNGERLNKLETILLPDNCQLQFADRFFYFEAEKLPVGS